MANEIIQDIPFEEIKDVYALRGKNKGCSVKLRGRVVLIAFLVNDGVSQWDKESETLFVENLKQTSKQLMVASNLSRADLDIAYAYCQVSVPYVVQKRNSSRFVTEVLRQFGDYQDIQEYQRHYEEKFFRDEACVSFVFNKDFRSYAMEISDGPISEAESPYGDEYSIVSFNPADPVSSQNTFIHELMHQFGAVDFYYPEVVKLKAEQQLPNSIMNGGTEIDAVTRYVIGWDSVPSAAAKQFLRSISHISYEDYVGALREQWE